MGRRAWDGRAGRARSPEGARVRAAAHLGVEEARLVHLAAEGDWDRPRPRVRREHHRVLHHVAVDRRAFRVRDGVRARGAAGDARAVHAAGRRVAGRLLPGARLSHVISRAVAVLPAVRAVLARQRHQRRARVDDHCAVERGVRGLRRSHARGGSGSKAGGGWAGGGWARTLKQFGRIADADLRREVAERVEVALDSPAVPQTRLAETPRARSVGRGRRADVPQARDRRRSARRRDQEKADDAGDHRVPWVLSPHASACKAPTSIRAPRGRRNK